MKKMKDFLTKKCGRSGSVKKFILDQNPGSRGYINGKNVTKNSMFFLLVSLGSGFRIWIHQVIESGSTTLPVTKTAPLPPPT
jgi:hypothetical protein